MLQKILTDENFLNKGLIIIRILTGIIIAKFGFEVFSGEAIHAYTQWLTDLHFPFPKLMVYLAKLSELIGGICLALGLFTRLVSIPLIITMIMITFIMGGGKIFSDDQHPFLLLLLFLNFLFLGGGKWSLDAVLFKEKKVVVLLLILLPLSALLFIKETGLQNLSKVTRNNTAEHIFLATHTKAMNSVDNPLLQSKGNTLKTTNIGQLIIADTIIINSISLIENPWLSTSLNILAQDCLENGDRKKAIEYYVMALKLWSENKEAKKALKDMKALGGC